MSKFINQQYLKTDQYRDATNLDVRANIHGRFGTNPYGWFNWVFDTLIKLPANAKILELGCGPAYLWRDCANRIPAGWNITLSDLSSGMVDAAWRNLVTIRRNFKFEEIDAQSIPCEDEMFDAVIANHMLYHVPERPKALAEIKRVLKNNGRLFATTVGENHMKEVNVWEKRVSLGRSYEPFTSPFTLENGLGQLTMFFSHVTMARYPDNLLVTEVEPIMAYIRSTVRSTELSEEELADVQSELEHGLLENSAIFITKDSGLFEAIK